jgi:signal transduction histidine kinase
MFNFHSCNFFILPLLVSILLLVLGIFVILKNPKSHVNLSFSFIILCAAVWLFSYARAYQLLDSSKVLWWFKLGYLGIIFMPITYYHFVNAMLEIQKARWVIALNYLGGLVFGVLVFKTKILINGLNYYSWGSYPKAGIIHPYFLTFFLGIANIAFFRIFYNLLFNKQITQIRREQLKYVLLAFLIFTFACIDFLPNYGIGIYPLGFIPTTLFLVIICYSIVRLNLLDIKIAVTRLSIFVTVYSLILGIPIWVGFRLLGQGLWLIPITLMCIFATFGPFIYLFIQKQAEDRLLKEQHRYQATLRQASAGMVKIKDLNKLLKMIVYVLTHAIQIEHAMVYIHEKAKNRYILGSAKKKFGQGQFVENLSEDSPLVRLLSNNKNQIIYEEIKQKSQDYKDENLIQIAQIIYSMGGELVVPVYIDQELIAMIFMGKKESGKPYSEDDLAVFGILANQTALAIENAKFYEDMKLTNEQLFQAEKMATIGTMADGLSHQINNRFHVLGFIAGDALDTIQLSQKDPTPEKLKEVVAELDRAFVRVQENVVQGGEIVQGLLKYTRKSEAGFTSVDVDAVLKAALEMLQFKIKIDEMKIIRGYDVSVIPKVKGNFTQLQEVFFNLIDNGYDAMMQRKNELKETSYVPALTVKVFEEDGWVKIIFEDNGMGVKEEDIRKLFTPFFTTKLSSKKGTGLGLYVIKKIVEDNHRGQVEMVSKHMHGTQIKLSLPIAIS